MHIENQANMAEAHTAFVVCKYINNYVALMACSQKIKTNIA